MKRLLIVCCAVILAGAAKAQTTATQTTQVEFSKEDKAKAKALKEQQEEQAYTQAGLTADEVTKVKAVNTEMSQKGKDLVKSTLADEEKEAKKKELSKEKKDKLIAILGADKYKAWQTARKQIMTPKEGSAAQ